MSSPSIVNDEDGVSVIYETISLVPAKMSMIKTLVLKMLLLLMVINYGG